MKLYNPFKAHIVELANGKFVVRKFSFFMMKWVYKENRHLSYYDFWWHTDEHAMRWCPVDTLEEATDLCNTKNKIKTNNVNINVIDKVTKVHG